MSIVGAVSAGSSEDRSCGWRGGTREPRGEGVKAAGAAEGGRREPLGVGARTSGGAGVAEAAGSEGSRETAVEGTPGRSRGAYSVVAAGAEAVAAGGGG